MNTILHLISEIEDFSEIDGGYQNDIASLAELYDHGPGKVLFDEKPAKTRDVARLVSEKLRQNDKMIFSVQTHSRTKYSDYIAVLDQLKIAKASRISIANPDQ